MFFKNKEKLKLLLAKNIVTEIRGHAVALDNMIRFIKDYGNVTKRKNNKLKQSEYLKVRNNILSLPLSLCVSNYIIKGSKRLSKKHKNLMLEVQSELTRQINQQRCKEELKSNVKKNIVKGAKDA